MKRDNPSFDYDRYGHRYSAKRQTDPRIASLVHKALGNASSVLNAGAGAGSYEPSDKYVVAVEPSKVMREQRHFNHKTPAVIASADQLPFDDNSFDASMAMLTIHHWPDIKKGLDEMRRVTRHQVVILTFDPDAFDVYWHYEYAPEFYEAEKQRFPKIDQLLNYLGRNSTVLPVPVPFDCVDGFTEAYYGRPEAFLQNEVRRAQSGWGFLPEGLEEEVVERLADALSSGQWDKKYGQHRNLPEFTGALRLVVT